MRKNRINTISFKYEAKIHIFPNTNKVKYIGTVKANSINELKKLARKHNNIWGEGTNKRIHLSCNNTLKEFLINTL